MKKIVLKAKPRVLKEEGDFSDWIKGVVYGPELKENKIVWVRLQDFDRVYKEAGRSTLIDLEIEGDKNEYSVLFYDIQYHGLTDRCVHLDLYKVKMGEKIDATVKLSFINEAPGVKEQGGVLVKNTPALEVRCFPRHLVGEIEVDLAGLKEIEDSFYVKDLKIPEEIEVITGPDTVVVSIARPRTTEELEKLDEKIEMDVDKVEVEKDGETEEGDESEAEEPENGVDKPKAEETENKKEDKKE
ncbi:MAG: 50S ribosomal protein L25 [Candidatus Moranbacteria bacterium]|nr:50S ribosomal protein L25 [Candidatus Moranbacteria bacterium]